jgi:hypothetical protein
VFLAFYAFLYVFFSDDDEGAVQTGKKIKRTLFITGPTGDDDGK